MDWIIPEMLCVKQGGYGGRVRYILKDTIKFIPLFGWYLGMVSGCVCVCVCVLCVWKEGIGK